MSTTLSTLTLEVIQLVRSRRIAEAQHLLHTTNRSARAESFGARQASVHQISLMIAEISRQKAEIMSALSMFSPVEQSLARPKLEQICRDLFDAELCDLRARKRKNSRST